MQECWNQDPKLRPTSRAVVEKLDLESGKVSMA